MQVLARRMFLRLPAEHPITISVSDGMEAMIQASDLLPAPDDHNFDRDQVLGGIDTAGDRLARHMCEFSDAVRELVGIEDVLSSGQPGLPALSKHTKSWGT